MIDRSNAAQQAAELSELLKLFAHAVQSRDGAIAARPAVIAGNSFFVGTFAGADQQPLTFAVDAFLFAQAMDLAVDKLETALKERGVEIGNPVIEEAPSHD